VSSDCPVCAGALRQVSIPGAEHLEGPVRASAEPRRTRRCDRGCGVGLDVAVDAALRARIIVAVRSRWPRSPDRCGTCRTVLGLPLRATTRSVTVEPIGEAPFTVTLDLPLGRCPACGLDNLPSALADVMYRSARAAAGADVGAEVSRPRRHVGRGSRRPA
jgi:hypothetical protein